MFYHGAAFKTGTPRSPPDPQSSGRAVPELYPVPFRPQLSFGVTLRFDGRRTTLLSYRFHLSLLPASGLRFVRIDLNAAKESYDPLHRPRCHIHPGFEGHPHTFPCYGANRSSGPNRSRDRAAFYSVISSRQRLRDGAIATWPAFTAFWDVDGAQSIAFIGGRGGAKRS